VKSGQTKLDGDFRKKCKTIKKSMGENEEALVKMHSKGKLREG